MICGTTGWECSAYNLAGIACDPQPYTGVPIYRVSLTRRVKVWEFPPSFSKYWAYELSDESWCRLLRIGREVERTETITLHRAIMVPSGNGAITFKSIPDFSL